MTRKLSSIPINTDQAGVSKTILAGYYKYGVQTLLLGDFGTTGTVVLDIYEDDEGIEHDRRRLLQDDIHKAWKIVLGELPGET